jgi:hypothetical protein
MSEINTHNLIVDFGKHNGERWTRVPIGYLRWILNQPCDESDEEFLEKKKIAQAELDRRGGVIGGEVEISHHAIDTASLRIRKIWHNDRKDTEGLYSWLVRVSMEALAQAKENKERVMYKDIVFIFKQGDIFPILKTVMPQSRVKYKKLQKFYRNFHEYDDER